MNKTLIASAFAAVALTSRLGAAPAVPGTLADYLALGPGGATIGSTLFSDFTLLPTQAGALEIAPTSILVTPIDLVGNPTLQFDFTQVAMAGQLFEMRIGYKVTDISITGAEVGLSLSTATNDAAITALLDVSGPVPAPPALVAFETSFLSGPSDQAAFPSTGVLMVEADNVIDGGLAGQGTGARVQNHFTLGVVIPEPGTAAFALALFGMCAVSRRGGRG
jgi:hypothetical protein